MTQPVIYDNPSECPVGGYIAHESIPQHLRDKEAVRIIDHADNPPPRVSYLNPEPVGGYIKVRVYQREPWFVPPRMRAWLWRRVE